MVVLLPEPLGPRKPKISPRRPAVDAADGLDLAVVLDQAVDLDDRLRCVHHVRSPPAMRLASSDSNAARAAGAEKTVSRSPASRTTSPRGTMTRSPRAPPRRERCRVARRRRHGLACQR